MQLKREAKLLTVIGLNTKHADCRIIFMSINMSKSICRQKEQKYPTSGGMVVLVNKNIQKGVACLTSSSSEIVW